MLPLWTRLLSLAETSNVLAWLTPDELPETRLCWRVFCPEGLDYEAALKGALALLGNEDNWQQFGTQAPEDVAELFRDTNHETFSPWERCMPVGAIIWGGWDSPPDGFLLCDGHSERIVDYPDLFDAIGYAFGGVGADFYVPLLIGRYASGTNVPANIGNIVGANSHTLTRQELGSHGHSYHNSVPVVCSGVGPVPVYGILPGLASTGTAGNNQAHENRPATILLTPVISFR